MSNTFLAVLCLLGALLIGCAPDGNTPATDVPVPLEITNSALPAPVVTIEATNTFIPIVEAQPSPTPSATPTLVPTPTSPIVAVALQPVVAEGLLRPTFLTHAFDERLFVLEQVGRIRIIENGQLLPDPFLDITDRVGATANEQGLLGLAFHPNYATPGATGEGQFYVNYTNLAGDTRISRFSVLADDPYRADPEREAVYLAVDQPYPNHNGGMLAFGPDGYLYVGLGDGGSGGDPLGNGQSRQTLLGKILRLDVDSAVDAYAIPSDNPFAGDSSALPEIWAYGLRNPWRFSFDREMGDLYVADVGQNRWEEVNFQPGNSAGGENYGWAIMEATHCYDAQTCDQTGLVGPIFEYDHALGCSVSGGYVYRGALFPEMVGNFFVADYCSGIIWRVIPEGSRWSAVMVLDSELVIPSFGEDINGELYVLDFGAGAVHHLVPGEAAGP